MLAPISAPLLEFQARGSFSDHVIFPLKDYDNIAAGFIVIDPLDV